MLGSSIRGTRARRKGKRNCFSPQEDLVLRLFVYKYGVGQWDVAAAKLPGRDSRQCAERWNSYLSPFVNNAPWSDEDLARLGALVQQHGRHWQAFQCFFPGRSDLNIRTAYDRWNRAQLPPRESPAILSNDQQKAIDDFFNCSGEALAFEYDQLDEFQ
jgi:hypothetical protein